MAFMSLALAHPPMQDECLQIFLVGPMGMSHDPSTTCSDMDPPDHHILSLPQTRLIHLLPFGPLSSPLRALLLLLGGAPMVPFA